MENYILKLFLLPVIWRTGDGWQVTEDGVRPVLEKTNPKTSTGPDSIPTHLLKYYASRLDPILTFIFNRLLQEDTQHCHYEPIAD